MVTGGSWVRGLLWVSAAVVCSFCASLSAQTPSSPIFYETQNSDEWVNHTLHIQNKYPRVLVVDASDHGPRHIRAASLNLNSRGKEDGDQLRTYKVHAVYKTLQGAADASQG